MPYDLKPFTLNTNDLLYLLQQVNFVPLFEGPANSNGIVNFDFVTMDAWDARGNLVWSAASQSGTYQGTALTAANVALLGHGFPQVSAPIGIRDVTGLHNNLFGDQAFWGAVDVPFRRDVPADFTNYVTTPGADYTPGHSVVDYMPRIISRTITTAGVNLLTDASGHYVNWDAARYATDAAYAALVDASGVNIGQLVEGAKIVAPANTTTVVLDGNGAPLFWSLASYQASVIYTTTLGVLAASSYGGLKDSTGGTLEDGEAIYYRPIPGGAMVNTGQTFQPSVLAYKPLIDANVDFSTGLPIDGTPITTTSSQSGYGLLETLGHVDFQNPTSGEIFIGSENPGVAPVNSWFAIFGQFFDHGLDLIGKGGNGRVTIALDPSDPLYGTIGPDGFPVTRMVITRASIAGTDANGDPNYVNHTSPFIDQSQTYGSSEQITNLLREWVSSDGGTSYHAGLELFDGTTLVDTWERRWPDGTTAEVHDTLPTLNELRQHVIDTGRAALNWADVLDYRNRDGNGQLADADVNTAGVQTSNSGHALILDMNPHFDAAHVSAEHLEALNTALANAALPTFTAANLSFGGLIGLGLINPSTNLINANFPSYAGGGSIPQAVQDALNDVMLDSVGDHYIAGDGRVNENFGLTSIHHVFHEEHNYQVENLKSWIYKNDNANSPVDHADLHQWQINTGTTDANGNYLNGDGTVAWDADKMFNATKLVVEMEYQHAAVDQYARTITPRIQEFVGYSTGVDATISLEYSQVAFRFGHSTIRETIDTIDPAGWMLGNVTRYALEKAFLAPQSFAEEGVAAITLGLSRQQMSEVDEFITPALNQGLLGLPLDLAAINIARGRDLGIPTLNDFRAAISLARYTSWADFGANMIHPESLANFIAAYSFNGDIALAEAAMLDSNFMNNTGVPPVAGADGFDHIDSWIGGLAEAHVPGGLLGETFDAVFVAQIQSLMDGDRFYYLYRLFGTNIHEEVNNGQFKDIVERNTGLSHLNGSIFAYADKYYDFNRGADGTLTDTNGDHTNHLYADLVATNGVFSDGGASNALNGTAMSVVASDGVRADVTLNLIKDARVEDDPTQVHTVEGTPTSGANSHEVIVATENRDFIHGRGGDDTIYGEGGDDYIYGDGGVDRLYGGAGNDLIDTGEGPDLADGGAGKDIIYGRGSGSEVGGFDQLVGGSGNDLVIGGEGIDKLSGGSGDDIIFGDGLTNPEMGNTDPFTHGGDGNDYIDGGASGDLLYGEEGDDYLVGGNDQDLIQGGQGDDILRPGAPSQAINGGPDEVLGDDGFSNTGFDLVDYSDFATGAPVTFSLLNQTNPLIAIDGTTPVPAMAQIEGIIGSKNNDTLSGEIVADATTAIVEEDNWLVGGSGNDTLTGSAGNDVLVGGSIRLDALIGQYDGADNGNLALGSAAWLTQAMATVAGGTGYGNNVEDAYTGASNQALGDLSGGLLAGVNATIAGTANDYEIHFAEMLRSRMFKDVVLGDGGVDGTADVARFTGNLSEYSLVAYNAQGAVVVDPYINWNAVAAVRVVDSLVTRDINNDGVMTTVSGDGSDLLIGVENLKFADQLISVRGYFDQAPNIDLRYQAVTSTLTLASDAFTGGGNGFARGIGWNGNWVETNDGANTATTGQIQVVNAGGGGGGGGNQALRVGGGDGAELVRTLDLAGKPNATISYSITEANFAAGETVQVQFAADGVNFVTLEVVNAATNNGGTHTFNVVAPGGGFSPNAAIKLVANTVATVNGGGAHTATFDNLTVTTPGPVTDAFAGNNNAVSYTELGAGVAISSTPRVTDPDVGDTTLVSATITLRNGVAGDLLSVGTLPAGIIATTTMSGSQTIVNLTGVATHAQYQAAIQAITYSSTSQNPTDFGTNTTREIAVTVNDGFKNSAVATTIVTVTGVDNFATALAADRVITNIGTGTTNQFNITVPDWALVANDTDPDGALVANALNAAGLTNLAHAGGNVTLRDATPAGGTFQYTVANSATTTLSTTVTVSQDTVGALDGTNLADIIIGNGNASTINANDGNDIVLAGGGDDAVFGGAGDDNLQGGTGDDTLVGGLGNDTFTYTAGGGGGGGGGGDGTDIIDGGANLAAGDRFILNGSNQSETFRILAITDPTNDLEITTLLDTLGYVLDPASDILVVRTQGNNTSIVAELSNIEEITINNQAVSTGGGNTGNQGADIVQIVGDFSGTSLALNTITINGSSGDDQVDISGLSSPHRIVFNAGTGADTVVGDVRQQDIVLRAGSTAPIAGAATLVGDDGDNRLSGTQRDDIIDGKGGRDFISSSAGNDSVNGGSGRDVINTGSGDDRVVGGDDNDRIYLGSGNDHAWGGAGRDVVYGNAGDDTFHAAEGDGRDTYIGGSGADTLDMSAIATRIEADLGNGRNGKGYATTESVRDTLLGIENIVTGAGDDVIVASLSSNVMDGGAGNDVFKFLSADHADGDTILNFEPGDRVDVSAFMGTSVSLVNGTPSQGQLSISFETINGEEFTVLHGNAGNDDFDLMIRGHQNLTQAN